MDTPPPPETGTPPDPEDRDGDRGGPTGLRRSQSWRGARENAERLLADADATETVLERANTRLRSSSASRRLGALVDDVEAALRMARLRIRGRYDHPAPERLVLLVAALLYLVNPMDVVPDVIPGAGFIDDAAILSWALGRLREEVDRFRSWEAAHPEVTAPSEAP